MNAPQNAPSIFAHPAGKAPTDWGQLEVDRIHAHLKAFQIKLLYSKNAASEMTGIRFGLKRLYDDQGPTAVRAQILETALSWESAFKNSWQTAMYRGASESIWFCDGGFYQI